MVVDCLVQYLKLPILWILELKWDVDKVHTRESDMHSDEIMISESQERMLIVTDSEK